MGTEARGASNAKAKRELGWEPRHPSWREGFAAAYASIAVVEVGTTKVWNVTNASGTPHNTRTAG